MTSIRRIVAGVLWLQLLGLGGCFKEDPSETGAVVINEFLASNQSGLADEDGERGDWIELKNTGTSVVSLEGWTLTDDPALPEKWVFPVIDIGPESFVVVFASGKDRKTNTLHTNFKLAASGDYLALFKPEDKSNPVSEWNPAYPQQVADIAYGNHSDPGDFYLSPPTPGEENKLSEVVDPFASAFTLSHPPGLFFEPIEAFTFESTIFIYAR